MGIMITLLTVRILIVSDRRRKILEEIHVKENQLQEIDFLRHELQNE